MASFGVVFRAKLISLHGCVTVDRIKACLSPDKVVVFTLLVLIWGGSTAPFFIFYSTQNAMVIKVR